MIKYFPGDGRPTAATCPDRKLLRPLQMPCECKREKKPPCLVVDAIADNVGIFRHHFSYDLSSRTTDYYIHNHTRRQEAGKNAKWDHSHREILQFRQQSNQLL